VTQDDFDFGPPPPRREPRRFEPPPWERDQFERHWKEQAEREQAEREAAAAAAQQVQDAEPEAADEVAAVAADAGPAAPPEEQSSEDRPRAHVNRLEESPEGEEQVASHVPAGQRLDEKQVELMMLELKAEEPPVLRGAWKVSLGAGVVVGLIGIVVGVWGIVAIARLGSAGAFGGMVLVAFGLAFVGIGGWLVFGAMREQGVL